MFTCGPDAHAFSPAALAGLRLCLNAPVLNTEELPVGPAKAAILLFVEEYGSLCLGMGVRSLESGQLAFYTYRGQIDESASVDRIMAPALRLAEGMGFLFDDDMMAAGTDKARATAYAAWMDLVGELEETLSEDMVLDELSLDEAPGASAPMLELDLADEASDDSLELMLDDQLADEFDDDDLDEAMLAEAAEALRPDPPAPRPAAARPRPAARRPAPAREPAPRPEPAVAGPPSLSKFRDAPGAPSQARAASEAPAGARKRTVVRKKDGGGAALGRVPIVKVRRGGGDDDAPGFLARVLGVF